MKIRRIALVAAGIILATVVAGYIALHLPQVKRGVAGRLVNIIAEETCLVVETDVFDYRLWPGAISAQGVTVTDSSGRSLKIEAIEASWSWRELIGQIPRLRRLVIDGFRADVFALPVACSSDSNEEPVDLWGTFAVDDLRVNRGAISGTEADLAFSAIGLQAHASLVDRHLGFRAATESVHLDRNGRSIKFGPFEAEIEGAENAIELKALKVTDGPLRLQGSGSAKGPVGTAHGDFTGVADLEEILHWWEPDWAKLLDSSDPFEFAGEIVWSVDSTLEGNVRLENGPVRLAGIDLKQFRAVYEDLQLVVTASHPSWGESSVTLSPDQSLSLHAHLQDANLEPALALARFEIPAGLPTDLRLSGDINAETTLPLIIDQIVGTADVEAQWNGGRAAFRGRADNGFFLDQLTGQYFGTEIDASGTIASDGAIDAECSINITNPKDTLAQLSPLLPDFDKPAVDGGPLQADLTISGTIADPEIEADVQWQSPIIEGNNFETANAKIAGNLNHIAWEATLEAEGGSVRAKGTASPQTPSVVGNWQIVATDLSALQHISAIADQPSLAGSITGDGTVLFEPSQWNISASLQGVNIVSERVNIPSFTLDIAANNDCLSIESAEAEVLGGRIQGSGTLCPAGPDGEVSVSLQWSELDPSTVFGPLPELAQGRVNGRLDLSGPVFDPAGEARVTWLPTTIDAPIESASLLAHLQNGVLTLASDQLQTVSGPLTLRADLPLGDLARPAEFWPSAPHGTWRVSLDGHDLILAPVFELLNRPDLKPTGSGNLKLRASWPPDRGGFPQVNLEFVDFEATLNGRRVVVEKPIILSMDNRGIVATEFDLRGDITHIAAGGSFNLITSEIDLSIEGSLDPLLAALFPIPSTIVEPITFDGRVVGPVDAWTGHVNISHEGGSIEISDPPLEITDASLEVQWLDGVLEIDGGSAQVNRGSVFFGGAWDPKSGQGIIAEIEDVTALLPGGIITRWDGLLALEPATDLLAHLVGDLSLKYGVWDYPFDLGAALRGEESAATPGADDISERVSLDLEIRGGSGVSVKNNLGQFGVRWNVLEVGGNAAEPRIIGDLNLLPGGVIFAAGHPIAIKRGLIQFTGDPLTDPLVEIIPEDQNGTATGEFGDLGSDSQQQVSNLAAAGLASGLGAVFGLENTTIRPEEIALEADDDTSTNFSIGQQLSHNTAIFLTTDLHNSQKRTTLLQLWRLPSFPGLTIQGQTRTDPGEADVKLLQRFSWGGTLASNDQPKLRKIRLEGDWPWSRRKLRKATGLVRDQPWDPFFLFLGDIRMERKLADRGWPEARVESRIEGTPERPIAVFTCAPGRHVDFSYEGDEISKDLRSRLLPLYHFPPLETATLAEMERIVTRRLWADGHPDASVSISSDGEGQVVVAIDKGPIKILTGPVLEGAPDETFPALMTLLSEPTELAQIAKDPERGDRVVRRFLASRGYRNVEKVESWTSPTSANTTEVHLRVEAGPLARAVRFDLVGSDPLGLTDAENFAIREDMTLNRGIVDQAVASLRRTYRKEGYTDAKVRSQIYEDGEQWAILLVLDPGSTAVIDRVEITGRRHLSESILLGGLHVEPGEIFLVDDLDDSVSRLVTFDPIERVSASTRAEAGKVVVDLDIVEKPRWTTEFGGGWNSDRGITARVGATDHNLLGRGLSLGLRGRWEQDFLQGRLILGLPPPPGGRFSAGLNASYTEDVLPAESEGDLVIRENIREATLEGRYRIRPGLWTRAYYRFTRTRSFEEDPFDPDFPFDITIDVAVLGSQIIIDRLDNPFDPRHGYYLGFDLSWADDILGSDKENIRGLLTSSLAIEPKTGWTWFQSLRVGAAKPFNGALDRQSRFFAGGPASIRGFKLDSVGPVETIGDTTIYAGGEALFVLNEELRFPLWQSLRGAAFIDTGQVWETWSDADFDLSVGAGVGLRWSTPIGPLWVDAAWPVANRGKNSGARYSFGIGRTF